MPLDTDMKGTIQWAKNLYYHLLWYKSKTYRGT